MDGDKTVVNNFFKNATNLDEKKRSSLKQDHSNARFNIAICFAKVLTLVSVFVHLRTLRHTNTKWTQSLTIMILRKTVSDT